MAYLYLDDGYPESNEYSNNYIFFNGENPNCFMKIIKNHNKLKKYNLKLHSVYHVQNTKNKK